MQCADLTHNKAATRPRLDNPISRRGRRNISDPANCGSTDADTRLGRLVHDLKCASSSDMFCEKLAARVHYLKETEEGIKQMSDIFEQVEKRGEKRGRIFGVIDIDRCHHMDDDEIIDDLMEAYHLTHDMAEEYLQEYYAECSVPT